MCMCVCVLCVCFFMYVLFFIIVSMSVRMFHFPKLCDNFSDILLEITYA